jgi:hypothetical protein
MSKNYAFAKAEKREADQRVNAIWSGIGFVMMVLIPLMAYAIAVMLLDANQQNRWTAIPKELVVKWQYDPYILIKILLTIVFAIILFGFYTFITSIFYRIFAPPRYGPLDAPPVRMPRGSRRSR